MKNTKKITLTIIIGALGVVFGDIGTSPLYAISAIFGNHGHRLEINTLNVYGIISLIIWSIMLMVSIKYIVFIMRANNEGEGGIIALTALIKNSKINPKYITFFVILGLIGVSLFYGDSAITPAISVLSAVEGLKIIEPNLVKFIVPITLLIIAILFWLQQYGTNLIGKLFGPIMLLWFLVIAGGGLWRILQHPDILHSISPLAAISFFIHQPIIAFFTMSAIMLTITGVEALYADMGHFGRVPIAKAWFLLVLPALLICYMGQGALILNNPNSISSPFYLLYPDFLHIGILILATFATIIASQAVISGAFSLTRQAINLGFLPKMLVRHTSSQKIGQVYLPFVNFALFIIIILLVIVFGESQKLANAYGMAVSFTLAIDTILFVVVARTLWRKSIIYITLVISIFLSIDLLFLSSNLTKLLKGGWFPLSLAIIILLVMTTWIKGQKQVSKKRQAHAESLQDFVDKIKHSRPQITRLPGEAIYIGHHTNFAPLALQASVEKLHELHKKVIVVSVNITNDSHILENKRVEFNNLKYQDGISQVNLYFGFHDSPNIPKALESARLLDTELNFDPESVEYFISQIKIIKNKRHNLSRWQKALFCLMAHNALSISDYYKLPTDRTIEIRSLVEI